MSSLHKRTFAELITERVGMFTIFSEQFLDWWWTLDGEHGQVTKPVLSDGKQELTGWPVHSLTSVRRLVCPDDDSFDHLPMYEEAHTILVSGILPTVPEIMAFVAFCFPKY